MSWRTAASCSKARPTPCARIPTSRSFISGSTRSARANPTATSSTTSGASAGSRELEAGLLLRGFGWRAAAVAVGSAGRRDNPQPDQPRRHADFGTASRSRQARADLRRAVYREHLRGGVVPNACGAEHGDPIQLMDGGDMDTVEPTTRFEVIFDVEGRNTAKFRNEITVHKRLSHPVSVELPTDEGPGAWWRRHGSLSIGLLRGRADRLRHDPAARLLSAPRNSAHRVLGQHAMPLGGAAIRPCSL